MGFSRWCSVESKCFELVVEGAATKLKILESSRGATRSILLNRKDSAWLLVSVEELIAAQDSAVFWRRSRSGFPGIFVQRCANKHGRFLTIEDYGGGRLRGSILVPEGKKGVGWDSFRMELSEVVKYMKAFKGDDKPPAKKPHAPMNFEPPRTVILPEPPRRRSFVETMMSPANGGEPLLQMYTKQKKWPELDSFLRMKKPVTSAVMKPAAPKPPAPKSVAPTSAMMKPAAPKPPAPKSVAPSAVMKPAAPKPPAPKSVAPKIVEPKSVAPSATMGLPGFSPAACLLEEGQKISLRDTLERIKGDVTRCLYWLDSGFASCGLLDSAPKPKTFSEVPIKKHTFGLLGSRPRISFKPKPVRSTGQLKIPGQPKDSGSGPVAKATRLEKGKALCFEGPRPNSTKPKSRWVKAQPGANKKDPAVKLIRVAGMGLPEASLGSTSAGAPSAASPPTSAPICLPEIPPVTVGFPEKTSPAVAEVPVNPENNAW